MKSTLFSGEDLFASGLEELEEASLTDLGTAIEAYQEKIGCPGFVGLGTKDTGSIICRTFDELLAPFRGAERLLIEDAEGTLVVSARIGGKARSMKVRFLTSAGASRLVEEEGCAFGHTGRKLADEYYHDRRCTRLPMVGTALWRVA